MLAEGYTGLRSASEMSLALAPIDHLDQAVEYEIALHASLFSARQGARFTALCYWDERLFGGTDAINTTVVNSTTITASTRPAAAGAVTVLVTNRPADAVALRASLARVRPAASREP